MEGLVKKIKGIRNEMIGLSIVLMLAGIFMILFPNTSGNIICRGVGAVLGGLPAAKGGKIPVVFLCIRVGVKPLLCVIGQPVGDCG